MRLYHNGKFVGEEPICSLQQYMDDGRFLPGQHIFTKSDDFWVGDCTMYIEPTTSDGGIGWTEYYLDQEVIEVHTFEISELR